MITARSLMVLMLMVVGCLGAALTTTASASSRMMATSNGRIAFEGWGRCTSGNLMCIGPTAPNYDIWTVASDGTGLINITRAPGVDADAAWSPDGQRLAFNSNRNGDYDIFVTDALGSETKQLTGGIGNDSYPSWAPSGRRIAYVNDLYRTQDIVIMKPDGTEVTRVASFLNDQVFGLDWSPDGRWLAFTRGDLATRSWNIFIIRPDGSGLRRVYKGPVNGESPSWSPDGRSLTFAGGGPNDESYDIWIVRRDGSGLRRIVKDDLWQDTPEWSPDGKNIVYLNERGDAAGSGDLWVVDVDGSNNHRLVAKADSYDYAPHWQPIP